jgi:hypothetical protein
MTTATKGRGSISIASKIWDDLGQPETPEAWHKALLLPENYKVVAIRPRYEPGLHTNTEIIVLVESDAIPRGDAHISQTQVTPYYCKHEDGKVELTRIELTQWDGERWQKVSNA